jgi:hypothetical protein
VAYARPSLLCRSPRGYAAVLAALEIALYASGRGGRGAATLHPLHAVSLGCGLYHLTQAFALEPSPVSGLNEVIPRLFVGLSDPRSPEVVHTAALRLLPCDPCTLTPS